MSTIVSQPPPTTTRCIEILDPSGEPEDVQVVAPTPRPQQLSDVTICLLDNGKPNTTPFLDRIEAGIKQRVPTARILRFTKLGRASAGEPAPEDILASISGQCRVAVNGIGD